jgi:hypothetical protein
LGLQKKESAKAMGLDLGRKLDPSPQFAAADKGRQDAEPQAFGLSDLMVRASQGHGITLQLRINNSKQFNFEASTGHGHHSREMCSEIQKMDFWPVNDERIDKPHPFYLKGTSKNQEDT